MFTSVFKKSTPLNYSLVFILTLFFFLLYQFQEISWIDSIVMILPRVLILVLLMATLFLTNFVCKKNGLSKDNTYTVLFFLLFLLFSPSLFNNVNLLATNFFLLLALRRLLSMQSLKETKEKIFDASLWILIASIFHPWCLLFLLLVFISIFFHVSNDYRNWFLPLIAFMIVTIGFFVFLTFQDFDVESFWLNRLYIDPSLVYFTQHAQNWAFAILMTISLFFLFIMMVSYSNKPQLLHSSYKKLIAYMVIALVVFFVSPEKNNDLLVLTFAPLAIMGTNTIEVFQQKIKQEIVLGVVMLCGLWLFFAQL